MNATTSKHKTKFEEIKKPIILTSSDSESEEILSVNISEQSSKNSEEDEESIESEEDYNKAEVVYFPPDTSQVEYKYQRFFNAFKQLPTIEELIQREEERKDRRSGRKHGRHSEKLDEKEMDEEEEEDEEEISEAEDSIDIENTEDRVEDFEETSETFIDEICEYDEYELASPDEESYPYGIEEESTDTTSLADLAEIDESFQLSEEDFSKIASVSTTLSNDLDRTKKAEKTTVTWESTFDPDKTRLSLNLNLNLNELSRLILQRKEQEERDSTENRNIVDTTITETLNKALEQSERDQLCSKLDKRKLIKALAESVQLKDEILADNNELSSLCGEFFYTRKIFAPFRSEYRERESINRQLLYEKMIKLDTVLKGRADTKVYYQQVEAKTKRKFQVLKKIYEDSIIELNNLILYVCNSKHLQKEFINTQLKSMASLRTEISKYTQRLILTLDKYANLMEIFQNDVNTGEINAIRYESAVRENQLILEKINDRKQEYQKMARRTDEKISRLAHLQEAIRFSQMKLLNMKKKYENFLKKLEKKRQSNANLYNKRAQIMKELHTLKKKSGLLANRPVLFEYDRTFQLVEVKKAEVNKLLEEKERLSISLGKYEQRCQLLDEKERELIVQFNLMDDSENVGDNLPRNSLEFSESKSAFLTNETRISSSSRNSNVSRKNILNTYQIKYMSRNSESVSISNQNSSNLLSTFGKRLTELRKSFSTKRAQSINIDKMIMKIGNDRQSMFNNNVRMSRRITYLSY